MIADAVKFRIVQSWADQGDPDAAAFLSMLGDTTVAGPAHHPRPGTAPRAQPVADPPLAGTATRMIDQLRR